MDLSISDVSGLLMLDRKEVEKLRKKGTLPCHVIQDKVRFSKHAVIEWALINNKPLNLSANAQFQEFQVESITPLLDDKSFHYNCSFTREDYIPRMVSQLELGENIDRNIIEELLMSREQMMSTAIGNGISLPHPRIPLLIGREKPLISFYFLKEPLDLNSIDGQPVYAIILLLSQTVKQHLCLLAHLSFLLYKDEFRAALKKQLPPEELLSLIKSLEKQRDIKV